MSVSLLRLGIVCALTLRLTAVTTAADPFVDPAPPFLTASSTNGTLHLEWTPFPAVEAYRLLQAPDASGPFVQASGEIEGLQATLPAANAGGIVRLEAIPINPNALLAATVLSRLAYGPTPDELERVRQIGPDAYIAEQLAPESLTEDLPHDRQSPVSGWQYVTATGTASSSILYVYLTAAGEGFIDDLKLVAGRQPDVGINLVRNGDFESPLSAGDWVIAANHTGSALSSSVQHSGGFSLHIKASEAGETRDSAIVQTLTPGLDSGQTYTLSYWWQRSNNSPAPLTIRLSGSGIVSSPGTVRDELEGGTAAIDDLRAWHTLNAIRSRRQLLEVFLQFLDNHFVTQYAKAAEYLDGFHSGDAGDYLATQLEFKELQRWRRALLNPQCTFHELLRISAESPSMIIYLDTVNNRGSQGRIANENYARELLELFTYGVDNGYDQRDIEEMAKVWTGWSVRYVRPDHEGNLFSAQTNLRRPGTPEDSTDLDDFFGTWSFVYKDYNHNTSSKYLFYEHDEAGERGSSKTYPARFGPKYAGKPYALSVSGRPGTNGVSEGYQVLRHLADQPFTQEHICVKLCRLFVHDDFRHGVYDYAAADLSPEAALVRDCMDAWDGSSPKGQVRVVLATIFDSDLFRRHGASQHKIKTPFEFAASALRALMVRNADGTFTANTDGYSLRNLMRRAGSMDLFNRGDPDGFPESGPPWISAGTLAERLRFCQSLLMPASYAARTENVGTSTADPAAVVRLKLPAARWRDPEAVADLFLDLLYPGEGRANLDAYRTIALNFLNTGNDGAASSPFTSLSTTGNPSPWETRLRGMVAFLMTIPLFQEQ